MLATQRSFPRSQGQPTYLLVEPDLDGRVRLQQLEDEVDRREKDSAPTAASASSHDDIAGSWSRGLWN